MVSSDHYDMDTTVYPEHYEELFRSMAEPPDTQEATPDLQPRVNLHVLIWSALDQAAAVPIPPSSVPPLTTTFGELLYTFQQGMPFFPPSFRKPQIGQHLLVLLRLRVRFVMRF